MDQDNMVGLITIIVLFAVCFLCGTISIFRQCREDYYPIITEQIP